VQTALNAATGAEEVIPGNLAENGVIHRDQGIVLYGTMASSGRIKA